MRRSARGDELGYSSVCGWSKLHCSYLDRSGDYFAIMVVFSCIWNVISILLLLKYSQNEE